MVETEQDWYVDVHNKELYVELEMRQHADEYEWGSRKQTHAHQYTDTSLASVQNI